MPFYTAFGLIPLYAELANASYLYNYIGIISLPSDANILIDVHPFLQSPQEKPHCGETKYAAKS